MEKVWTTSETAKRLGVSPHMVRVYFHQGKLTGRIVRSRLLIDRRAVDRFVRPKRGRPKKAS